MRVRVVAVVAEENGDDAERAERGDECEGERDAAEVRGDTGKRGEAGTDPARRPVADRGVGDEETRGGADDCRDEADLDRRLERVAVRRLEHQPYVLERPPSGRGLERTGEHRARGREEEEDGVREEGQRGEPRI